jgi:Protein of unknown function (DUF1559)
LVAVILAIPASLVATGADDQPITKKDLLISTNNLKQIALAFHSYHDATNGLPSNITDKDGKPLLSWRVAILPYVEESQVYKQFNLEEPWDSATNKKLIEKMPSCIPPCG